MSKITKKQFKELKEEGKISKMNFCCPKCSTNQLRAWEGIEDGYAALCYNCGILFFEGIDLLIEMPQTYEFWDALATKFVSEIKEECEEEIKEITEYKSNDLDTRKHQYANYLRKRLLNCGIVNPKNIDPLNDTKILKSYSFCCQCGIEIYSEDDLNKALLNSNDTERTFDILNEVIDAHLMEEYIKNTKVKLYEIDKETWRHPKYSSIIVTYEMREYIINLVAKEFVEWVKNGSVYEINYDNDTDWDNSGELERFDAMPTQKLTMFNTIGKWMEEMPTGEKRATYCSGCGFDYPTIDSEIYDLIQSKCFDIWGKKFMKKEWEDISDEIFDDLDTKINELFYLCSFISNIEAWVRGNEKTK